MIGFLIKLLFFTISDKLFVLREIFRSAPDIRRRITNFSLYDNILQVVFFLPIIINEGGEVSELNGCKNNIAKSIFIMFKLL